MFYVEPKGNDTIELQEGMYESEVIDRARNFDFNVDTLRQAIKTLNENGYDVFQDD